MANLKQIKTIQHFDIFLPDKINYNFNNLNVPASETYVGITQIATLEEMSELSNDEKIVTSSKLNEYLTTGSVDSSTVLVRYNENIGSLKPVVGNINPNANSFRNIGSQNNIWNNIYVNDVVFNSESLSSKLGIVNTYKEVGDEDIKLVDKDLKEELVAGGVSVLRNGTTVASNNVRFNDRVTCMAVSGNKMYVGGWFTSVSSVNYPYGVVRNNCACIEDYSRITDWNPELDDIVSTIALSGNNVYVGGHFTSVGGQPKSYFALFDTSGNLNPLDLGCNASVSTISLSSNNIYLAGSFTTVSGGVPRNFCALFNTDGVLSAWDPNPNAGINDISLSGNHIYLAGSFTSVSGVSRLRGALFDTDGYLSAWDPKCNDTIRTIKLSGNNIYIGGDFTTVSGGVSRVRAALFNTDGYLSAWNPSFNSSVTTIETSGENIYLGGYFTTTNGSITNRAALITTNNIQNDAGISFNNYVYKIILNDENLHIAGRFTSLTGYYVYDDINEKRFLNNRIGNNNFVLQNIQIGLDYEFISNNSSCDKIVFDGGWKINGVYDTLSGLTSVNPVNKFVRLKAVTQGNLQIVGKSGNWVLL